MIAFFFCRYLQSEELEFMQLQGHTISLDLLVRERLPGVWYYVVGMVSSRSRALERITESVVMSQYRLVRDCWCCCYLDKEWAGSIPLPRSCSRGDQSSREAGGQHKMFTTLTSQGNGLEQPDGFASLLHCWGPLPSGACVPAAFVSYLACRWLESATCTSLCVSLKPCSLWPSLIISGQIWRQSLTGRSVRRTQCLFLIWMRMLLICQTLGASLHSFTAKAIHTSIAGSILCHPCLCI